MQRSGTSGNYKACEKDALSFMGAMLESEGAVATELICPCVFLACHVRQSESHVAVRGPFCDNFEKAAERFVCSEEAVDA